MRKFIQKYHRGSNKKEEEEERERVVVPLDILVEVDKVTFIIEDDWFEVKMRANYVVCGNWRRKMEGVFISLFSLSLFLNFVFVSPPSLLQLMLDEYQQRVGRIESLNEKLRKIQDTQGPLSQVSGK